MTDKDKKMEELRKIANATDIKLVLENGETLHGPEAEGIWVTKEDSLMDDDPPLFCLYDKDEAEYIINAVNNFGFLLEQIRGSGNWFRGDRLDIAYALAEDAISNIGRSDVDVLSDQVVQLALALRKVIEHIRD